METYEARADQIRVGDTFIGRRTHHLTVESLSRTAHAVTFRGVNGWGDPMVMRYGNRYLLDVFKPQPRR